MQVFLHYLLIAIAMGLDAFSLSLSLGMQRIAVRRMIVFSLVVGCFHYLLPYIGQVIGHWFLWHVLFLTIDVTGILFMVIGFYMVFAAFGEKRNLFVSGHWLQLFLLGIAVSFDSLSIGFSLSFAGFISSSYLFLFGFVAMVLTCLGIYIGRRMRLIARLYSELIGGLILLILGCIYLFT